MKHAWFLKFFFYYCLFYIYESIRKIIKERRNTPTSSKIKVEYYYIQFLYFILFYIIYYQLQSIFNHFYMYQVHFFRCKINTAKLTDVRVVRFNRRALMRSYIITSILRLTYRLMHVDPWRIYLFAKVLSLPAACLSAHLATLLVARGSYAGAIIDFTF